MCAPALFKQAFTYIPMTKVVSSHYFNCTLTSLITYSGAIMHDNVHQSTTWSNIIIILPHCTYTSTCYNNGPNAFLVLNGSWWCLCTWQWRQCSSNRFGPLWYTRKVWNGQFTLFTVLYTYCLIYVPEAISFFMEALLCVQIQLQLTQRLYDSMMCHTKYC